MGDLYAIILHNADSELWEKLEEFWPRHYVVSDTVALIRDDSRTTREISKKLFDHEDGMLFVVFQVNRSAYFGNSFTALWEWLAKGGGS